MTGNKELKALRKEEFASFKIEGRNKKKLDEIEHELGSKKLDLLEATIELHRLENDYNYKYSENSTNAPASWAKYLETKKIIEKRISQLEENLQKEKVKKKDCYKQSEKAKRGGDSGESAVWLLEAKDHIDVCKDIKIEISELCAEIAAAKKAAEKDPDYMDLQTRIKLAKKKQELIEKEISDLQKEQKAQKKVYEDSVKEHKSIKDKIEKLQKQMRD